VESWAVGISGVTKADVEHWRRVYMVGFGKPESDVVYSQNSNGTYYIAIQNVSFREVEDIRISLLNTYQVPSNLVTYNKYNGQGKQLELSKVTRYQVGVKGLTLTELQNYRLQWMRDLGVDQRHITYKQNTDGTYDLGIIDVTLKQVQEYRMAFLNKYGFAESKIYYYDYQIDAWLVGVKGLTFTDVQNYRLQWMRDLGVADSDITYFKGTDGKYFIGILNSSFRQVEEYRMHFISKQSINENQVYYIRH
jgi:hypothetical protein